MPIPSPTGNEQTLSPVFQINSQFRDKIIPFNLKTEFYQNTHSMNIK